MTKEIALLSVVIITYNEEKNIRDCLECVKWADEIIIVDGFSSDKTIAICQEYTDKIYQKENVSNLNINKSYGFEKARGKWIIHLDADERVSVDLAKEIREVVSGESKFEAYKIPRQNYYFGRWLKYGGHFPDYQLRLFKSGKARFECQHVHERLQVEGRVGCLNHPLVHHSYPTISQYLTKFDFYTRFEADYMFQNKKRYFAPYELVINPISKFIRRYFFKLGFLDGLPGFLACVFHSLSIIVSYAKYREKRLCPRSRHKGRSGQRLRCQ